MFCCRIPLVITLVFSLVVSSCATAAELKPSVSVKLTDRSAEVRWYPAVGPVKGRLVFGSGDGGWSYWEERVCSYLSKHGWSVAGLDFQSYAKSDFNARLVAGDMARLGTWVVEQDAGLADTPLVYGGWSMGAEHSVASAAVAELRPKKLSGLLLVAPGKRGRYGLRLSDRLGMAPTGEGTFALADFADRLRPLRVSQWHAKLDLLDSTEWLKQLNAEHHLIERSMKVHDFGGADDEFLTSLIRELDWLTSHESPRKSEGQSD